MSAFVLVGLVGDLRAVPDDAAQDLHCLLGHRLACPPTGVLRYDRLQLLLRWCSRRPPCRRSTNTKPAAKPTDPTPPPRRRLRPLADGVRRRR